MNYEMKVYHNDVYSQGNIWVVTIFSVEWITRIMRTCSQK